MFNRLYQYVHTNEILAPEQFGFRKESNTEKAKPPTTKRGDFL